MDEAGELMQAALHPGSCDVHSLEHHVPTAADDGVVGWRDACHRAPFNRTDNRTSQVLFSGRRADPGAQSAESQEPGDHMTFVRSSTFRGVSFTKGLGADFVRGLDVTARLRDLAARQARLLPVDRENLRLSGEERDRGQGAALVFAEGWLASY